MFKSNAVKKLGITPNKEITTQDLQNLWAVYDKKQKGYLPFDKANRFLKHFCKNWGVKYDRDFAYKVLLKCGAVSDKTSAGASKHKILHSKKLTLSYHQFQDLFFDLTQDINRKSQNSKKKQIVRPNLSASLNNKMLAEAIGSDSSDDSDSDNDIPLGTGLSRRKKSNQHTDNFVIVTPPPGSKIVKKTTIDEPIPNQNAHDNKPEPRGAIENQREWNNSIGKVRATFFHAKHAVTWIHLLLFFSFLGIKQEQHDSNESLEEELGSNTEYLLGMLMIGLWTVFCSLLLHKDGLGKWILNLLHNKILLGVTEKRIEIFVFGFLCFVMSSLITCQSDGSLTILFACYLPMFISVSYFLGFCTGSSSSENLMCLSHNLGIAVGLLVGFLISHSGIGGGLSVVISVVVSVPVAVAFAVHRMEEVLNTEEPNQNTNKNQGFIAVMIGAIVTAVIKGIVAVLVGAVVFIFVFSVFSGLMYLVAGGILIGNWIKVLYDIGSCVLLILVGVIVSGVTSQAITQKKSTFMLSATIIPGLICWHLVGLLFLV